MTAQLVVGFDNTRASTRAVWWAATRAESHAASLEIVMCHPPIDPDDPGRTEPAAVALATLADLVRLEHPGLEVSTSVVPAPPCEVLSAATHASHLLVIGCGHATSAVDTPVEPLARQITLRKPGPFVVVHDPVPIDEQILAAERSSGPYRCVDGCRHRPMERHLETARCLLDRQMDATAVLPADPADQSPYR